MNGMQTFVYLTACAVTKTKAVLEETNFDALWNIAGAHNMTALTAKALSDTAAFQNSDPQEKKRWQNALDNSVKKTMLFKAELAKIVAFLEKSGIWYMPLKGAVINELYPSFGTREFADNDILFDNAFSQKVKQFFLEKGYSFRCDSFAADEYEKPPFYNFEMHRLLFDNGEGVPLCVEYYQNIKEKLLKDEGNAYGYHFTDDDFYIYFIVHAFKHYDSKGTGFRTVADEYVILNSGKFRLDFSYIEEELGKLGARDFERQLRSLCTKLFDAPEKTEKTLEKLDEQETEMLQFVLSCGTFGKMDNLFAKELTLSAGGKKPSKARYIFKRFFPDISRYKYSHPFVYRHKIVYPFFLVYRLAVNPIKHRRYLKQELSSIKKIKTQ